MFIDEVDQLTQFFVRFANLNGGEDVFSVKTDDGRNYHVRVLQRRWSTLISARTCLFHSDANRIAEASTNQFLEFIGLGCGEKARSSLLRQSVEDGIQTKNNGEW